MKHRILIVLNYYHPYISGLSECAKSLAEELAKKHNVTVLTSKHKDDLEEREEINGVNVVRANLLVKISKGYVSPDFINKFRLLQKEADFVNLHLPMAEAAVLSYLTAKEKLLITYHCDVNMPNSFINSTIVNAMDFSSRISCNRAHKIVTTSIDYASYSRVLPLYKDKWTEIHPTSSFYREFDKPRRTNTIEGSVNIGFCGRIVEEKGIDILLKAAPLIKKQIPNARFLIAGDYKNVAGGSIYNRLAEEIGWDESYISFLGKLTMDQLMDFYYSLDLFVLPSINSLEAFGMVQVEAMLAGVPVVASDLPGVRGVTRKTGMGEIVEPRNVDELASAVIKVLQHKEDYVKDKQLIQRLFGVESAAEKYNSCLEEMNIRNVN